MGSKPIIPRYIGDKRSTTKTNKSNDGKRNCKKARKSVRKNTLVCSCYRNLLVTEVTASTINADGEVEEIGTDEFRCPCGENFGRSELVELPLTIKERDAKTIETANFKG